MVGPSRAGPARVVVRAIDRGLVGGHEIVLVGGHESPGWWPRKFLMGGHQISLFAVR